MTMGPAPRIMILHREHEERVRGAHVSPERMLGLAGVPSPPPPGPLQAYSLLQIGALGHRLGRGARPRPELAVHRRAGLLGGRNGLHPEHSACT